MTEHRTPHNREPNAAAWALVGTISAALIAAAAAVTVALLQRPSAAPAPPNPGPHDSGVPSTTTTSSDTSTPPTSPTLAAPTSSTTPATPDGVTYACTGSAPDGVNITYGPSASSLQATSLPFTAHDHSVSQTAQYYSITAQLNGSGEVSCTLTVTAAGRTTTSSGTARGGHNEATPEVCADYRRQWQACG